jgi:putative ABC transport system permease protein
VFVEAGFFFGVLESQSNLATLIRGDLVVLHRTRTHLNKWSDFERIRMNQVSAIPGVAAVVPVYKGAMGLRNAETGQVKRIIVYAFAPEAHPFDIGDREAIATQLRIGRTVLFDRRSRRIYGDPAVGEDVSLNRQPYRVGGFVDIGPNIINDGAVVMSAGEWLRQSRDDDPIMGIVRLREGADLEAVRARIAALTPGDVNALTPVELGRREEAFTAAAAPIGIVFGIGLLAGLVVGGITCYQILFNEISDQIDQFAMLKAMGFSNGFLGRIVLEQTLLFALLGFAVAFAISYAAYGYIAFQTALVMLHAWPRILGVLGLTVAMCVVAGLVAIRRAAVKSPAELL